MQDYLIYILRLLTIDETPTDIDLFAGFFLKLILQHLEIWKQLLISFTSEFV